MQPNQISIRKVLWLWPFSCPCLYVSQWDDSHKHNAFYSRFPLKLSYSRTQNVKIKFKIRLTSLSNSPYAPVTSSLNISLNSFFLKLLLSYLSLVKTTIFRSLTRKVKLHLTQLNKFFLFREQASNVSRHLWAVMEPDAFFGSSIPSATEPRYVADETSQDPRNL